MQHNLKLYKIERNTLNVYQYQYLRSTTDWQIASNNQIHKALSNDIFSVSIFKDLELVGMGRVIGDGALYFYIQDLIVHPDHKNQGVGKLMMNAIQVFLNSSIKEHGFVGLMSAKNVSGFYKKFGYTRRTNDAPGMYKIIKNNV